MSLGGGGEGGIKGEPRQHFWSNVHEWGMNPCVGVSSARAWGLVGPMPAAK